MGPGLVSGGLGCAAAEAAASGSAAAGRPTAYCLTAVARRQRERKRVGKVIKLGITSVLSTTRFDVIIVLIYCTYKPFAHFDTKNVEP